MGRWKDNGLVCVVSNEHGLQFLKNVECYFVTEKKKIAVSMPNAINMYNRHMGVVDRFDENISLFRIVIRRKMWYFPLFCYLLNVCVKNAWLLARARNYSDDMLPFTRSIVQCWLTKYGTSSKNPRRQRLSASFLNRAAQFEQIAHYIVKSDSQLRKRCKHCRSRTIFICKKCDIDLHLKCSLEYCTAH